MSYRISSLSWRWLSYLGLPLAVLMVLVGQSRQTAEDAYAAHDVAPQTMRRSTLAELPEFQAVTDRTTELGPEEMPAYWRLLNETARQSFATLGEQSHACDGFAQLLESPQEYRGAALQVTLNVRRVLDYEITGSSHSHQRLYEVWGWLDGAPEQLVVAVTSELPAGMQVGATVYERANVCGYFLKLQGYLPAGAEARMSPLAAPLLIGRLQKCTQPKLTFAKDKDWWRIGAGTLLVLSLVGSFSLRSRMPQNSTPPIDAQEPAELHEWLAEQGRLPTPSQPDADSCCFQPTA